MTELTFTQATGADAHLLAAILTEAAGFKISHQDTAWGTEPYSDKEALQLIKDCPTYIVHQNGKIVGTVALGWQDERDWGQQLPNAGYIHRLAIKDGFHGQGIGEQIIDWAVKEVIHNNRQLLRLCCDVNNTQLCAYYEKQDFVQVGTKEPEENGYTAALYERRLSAEGSQ